MCGWAQAAGEGIFAFGLSDESGCQAIINFNDWIKIKPARGDAGLVGIIDRTILSIKD